MDDYVYVSIGIDIIPLSRDIVEKSTVLSSIIEADPGLGTILNPIPLHLDISEDDLSLLLLYLKDNNYSGNQSDNATFTITLVRFYDYIGYVDGVNSTKNEIVDRVKQGDFANYGYMLDMLLTLYNVFNFSQRDLYAVMLNPIYYFSGYDKLMSNRGTVQEKKQCLLEKYRIDHEDTILLQEMFAMPDDIILEKGEQMYIGYIQAITITKEAPGKIGSYLFVLSSSDVYNTMHSLTVTGISKGYPPFYSMSGNTLNIVDNKIGDILVIKYMEDDPSTRVTRVINANVYDVTNSTRDKNQRKEKMLNEYDGKNIYFPRTRQVSKRILE